MHFARLHWLNSFRRQLMAASAGGVLFVAGLIIAALFAILLFQGSLFSKIGVSEYAETIGEELQFDAAGQPDRREPPADVVALRQPAQGGDLSRAG